MCLLTASYLITALNYYRCSFIKNTDTFVVRMEQLAICACVSVSNLKRAYNTEARR